jgi:hypothetical protein
VAAVIEEDGDLAVNGTVVIFETTLGSFAINDTPTSVSRTTDGVARIDLRADPSLPDRVGIARVTGKSGTVVSNTIDVRILLGAVEVFLTANPRTLPCGGGQTTLTASVRDSAGQPIPNEEVVFEASEGTLQQASVNTNDEGKATNMLTTTKDSVVSVSVFGVDAKKVNIDLPDECP